MARKVLRGQYWIDFTYNGQRVRGSVPCETLVALITGAQDGQGTENLGAQGAIPFSRFVEEFYLPRHAKPNKRGSAYEADLCSIVALKKFFGSRELHLISKSMREEFKHQRLTGILSASGKPCANNTINRELSCLNQIMEYAKDMGYLNENLLDGLKRLPVVHRERYWLTCEQFERLLKAAREYEGGRYLSFIEFVTYTGARRGEALAFRKADIDWERGEVRLATLKKRKRKNAERFLSIKDIGPKLEALLRRLTAHPQTGYCFAARSGNPWNAHNLDATFITLRKKAGLDAFHLHDLRHTFAMHRAMTRVTFRQLQIELGHSSPQSIQAYLEQAERFDARQSIFYRAPEAAIADQEQTKVEVAGS